MVWSVAFSPDGKLLASCSDGGVDRVGEIRLWDVATQKQVGMIRPAMVALRALAFSPDGKFLASGGIDDFVGGCTVRIWDVDEQIASGNSKEVAILHGHTSWVEDIAFSPGGRWLASGSQDGTVLLWEVNLPGGPRPVEPEGKLPGTWGEVKKTALLQNYPNPFNPETWIPYRLEEDANVVISTHSTTGSLVRRLELGHRNAGSYTSREKAVYWDGRNESGEPVSSGIYFYTLEAGSFSQTRKMTVLR
jgi:WD40 repeat protein